jgi:hypothetical protein
MSIHEEASPLLLRRREHPIKGATTWKASAASVREQIARSIEDLEMRLGRPHVQAVDR